MSGDTIAKRQENPEGGREAHCDGPLLWTVEVRNVQKEECSSDKHIHPCGVEDRKFRRPVIIYKTDRPSL